MVRGCMPFIPRWLCQTRRLRFPRGLESEGGDSRREALRAGRDGARRRRLLRGRRRGLAGLGRRLELLGEASVCRCRGGGLLLGGGPRPGLDSKAGAKSVHCTSQCRAAGGGARCGLALLRRCLTSTGRGWGRRLGRSSRGLGGSGRAPLRAEALPVGFAGHRVAVWSGRGT